jgi:hypothetical protein
MRETSDSSINLFPGKEIPEDAAGELFESICRAYAPAADRSKNLPIWMDFRILGDFYFGLLFNKQYLPDESKCKVIIELPPLRNAPQLAWHVRAGVLRDYLVHRDPWNSCPMYVLPDENPGYCIIITDDNILKYTSTD